jgi:hypothetical protein
MTEVSSFRVRGSSRNWRSATETSGRSTSSTRIGPGTFGCGWVSATARTSTATYSRDPIIAVAEGALLLFVQRAAARLEPIGSGHRPGCFVTAIALVLGPSRAQP